MSAHITIVGSLNMDLVIRSSHIPQKGETIIGRDFQTIPGGKGANQAVAAARLGGQVNMVGRVGKDSFADILLENLNSSKVDAGYIKRDVDSATGVALIVVDDTGENIIVVASGANMTVTEADVEAAEQIIKSSDVLLLQLEVPVNAVTRATQIACQFGVTVILNPAPAQRLSPDLLNLVDIIVPNEIEAELLTGIQLNSQVDLENASNRLLESGVKSVVITLGGRGSFFADSQHQSENVKAFEIKPVDTTAAGDAFLGGLAVNIGEGRSLSESVRWANAAGALAAMRFGAQTSLPSRDEVLRLISGESPEHILKKDL
jgi:ribokinase